MLVGSRASIKGMSRLNVVPLSTISSTTKTARPFSSTFDYGNVQQLYFIIRHLAHAVAGDNQKIYLKRHWDGPD